MLELLHFAGQTLADAISSGIGSSSIVLVCISQGYYESNYCKKGEILAVSDVDK